MAALQQQIEAHATRLKAELQHIDGNLSIELQDAELPPSAWISTCSAECWAALVACPNGVIRKSQAIAPAWWRPPPPGRHPDRRQRGSHPVPDSVTSTTKAATKVEAEDHSSCHPGWCTVRADGGYPGWAPDPAIAHHAAAQDTQQALFGESYPRSW
jgi:hypothetical protein